MTTFIKISLLSLLCCFTATSQANQKEKVQFSSVNVGPGLYMLSGVGGFTGGNIGLSVGDDGVVMIDDGMPPVLGIMKAAITHLTDKPIDFLINTHVHGDHTGNNAAIADSGAKIVAHENLRTHLLTKGVKGKEGMQPAPKSALPVITFSHAMNFHLNGQNAHIFHVANAHTDGDAIIHFKEANVIHTGDTLFNGMFPFIDLENGGSIDGYIAAQKKIARLSNEHTKIIPGHGPLATKRDLHASIAMLEDSKSIISKLLSNGRSEEEILKINPLAKYHQKWHWGFITTGKMTKQLIQGLAHKKSHNHSHSHHAH